MLLFEAEFYALADTRANEALFAELGEFAAYARDEDLNAPNPWGARIESAGYGLEFEHVCAHCGLEGGH